MSPHLSAFSASRLLSANSHTKNDAKNIDNVTGVCWVCGAHRQHLPVPPCLSNCQSSPPPATCSAKDLSLDLFGFAGFVSPPLRICARLHSNPVFASYPLSIVGMFDHMLCNPDHTVLYYITRLQACVAKFGSSYTLFGQLVSSGWTHCIVETV